MAESPDKHIKCPECGYRLHWKLGDGRLKCKRCGKRFKHNPLKPGLKLDRKVEKEIARLFRLGVPAAKAARDLGIHGNTAYWHYKRLREQIAADREAQLEKLHGHVEADGSYLGGERHGKRGAGAAPPTLRQRAPRRRDPGPCRGGFYCSHRLIWHATP